MLPIELREALEQIVSGKVLGDQVRRLTPTECERLMGWPDGWTFSQKWMDRLLAEALSSRERELDKLVPTQGDKAKLP